jgi:hypothetical protein
MEARSLVPTPDERSVSGGLLPEPGLLIFIRFEERHVEHNRDQLGVPCSWSGFAFLNSFA